MTPEQKQAERQHHWELASYYRTLNGPHKPEDRSLFTPSDASEVTKGMPLTAYQAERVTGVVASLDGPDRRAVRSVCREVGIKDTPTISEIDRRHRAMLNSQQDESIAKSLDVGFDSAHNAAFTLAVYSELLPRPVPWQHHAPLCADIQKAIELGVDVDSLCPDLLKAVQMDRERREAIEFAKTSNVPDVSATDELLFKASKPLKLGPKLLKPYLLCRIREVSKSVYREHVYEQQDMARSMGAGEDYPAIGPLDMDRSAEYVWARLVERASGQYADPDPNLVAGLEMVGRKWVVTEAKKCLGEFAKRMNPMAQYMNTVSPAY